MINTTKGPMDEALLEKREGGHDNEDETLTWVEYWHEGELVHRSADLILKKPAVFAEGTAAVF